MLPHFNKIFCLFTFASVATCLSLFAQDYIETKNRSELVCLPLPTENMSNEQT